MPSPVNIRVMTRIPFPALVAGSAPIAISKANGIWTVALDVHDLATAVPLTTAYATDYVIVWDDVAGTFSKVSLAALGLGGARMQRLVTSGANLPIAGNDQIINLNCAAPLAITLPSYAIRSGVPLTFKDVGGKAAANHITINRASANASENIDGNVSTALIVNYQSITLVPANDGTTTGWSIE